MKKFGRREFIGVGAAFVVFASCAGKPLQPSDPPPDIVLKGDENALSETLSQGFQVIADVAGGKRKNVRVGFEDNAGESRVVSFALASGAGVGYAHPLAGMEGDAEPAHLVLRTKNFLPSVALVDGNGETLKRDGEPLERGLDVGDLLSSLRAAPQAMREEIKNKVISAAVKAVAVIFVLWLGISIAKSVIGALAFIAFMLLLLALVLAGFGKLDEALGWIFEKTGIDFLDIQEFFEQVPDKLADFLRGVADFVEDHA